MGGGTLTDVLRTDLGELYQSSNCFGPQIVGYARSQRLTKFRRAVSVPEPGFEQSGDNVEFVQIPRDEP